jgi:hypothetical protein
MIYRTYLRERGFHTTLMTTFSFDPILFQNMVLLSLSHHGSRNIGILTDTRMFNQSVVDLDVPSLAGRNYHLAKRTMRAGAFHPKLVLQIGRDKGRLMIGSSNLTAAGVSGNLEACSLLRYDQDNLFTSGIFKAAFDYFSSHAARDDDAMHSVLDRAQRNASWLRRAEANSSAEAPDGFRLQFVTEGDIEIGEQFAAFIGGDEITRLIIVSPFQDENLSAVIRLRERLGASNVQLVPDLSEQDFSVDQARDLSWLTINSPEPLGVSKQRRLHAKIIIAEGARGDYVLTGSANASIPALFGTPGGRCNAEAGLMRMLAPGTAVTSMQLPLDEVLALDFPQGAFNQRQRKSVSSNASTSLPPDGGSVDFRNGVMRWRPPASDFLAQALIFRNAHGIELQRMDAIKMRCAWIEIPEDWKPMLKDFRSAVVLRQNGSECTPMTITFLDEISHNARPPQSQGLARILADLEASEELDDLFDKIRMLSSFTPEAMGESQERRMKRGTAHHQKNREDVDADLGDARGFLEIDETDEQGNTISQTAQIQSVRATLDRIMGRLLERNKTVEEELEELTGDVTSDEEKMETTVTPPVESTDNFYPGEPTAGPARDIDVALQETIAKRQALDGIIHFIENFEVQLRDLMTDRAVPELPSDHAALFEMLVLMTMALAATDETSVAHPLPALSNESHGGWIKILGRTFKAHCEHWSSPAVLKSDLADDQISALATLGICSLMILPFLDRYDLSRKSIVLPMQMSMVSFQKSLDEFMLAGSTNRIVFDQRMRQLRDHPIIRRFAVPNQAEGKSC